MMVKKLSVWIVSSLVLMSCKDKVPESQVAAQVGESMLTVGEVKLAIPLGMTGSDSATFAQEYIDSWIDERILFENALKSLPDIDRLNLQAEEYRRMLIAQSYENELLRSRVSENISEEESQEFYKKHAKMMRLEHPIVQGVFVKILLNSSMYKDVKKWLQQLNEGNTDCVEEFDQYGLYRAADYDNFFDVWVPLYRLSDKLPETVVDVASFLKCKTYEMKDNQYYYLFVIKDYRLAGEITPYEFAKSEIYEKLMQQRRKTTREKLLEDLRNDGLRSGFVKKN